MKKVIGHAVSVFGIVLMVVGFGIVEYDVSFLGWMKDYVSWIGIGLVGVGVLLALLVKDEVVKKGAKKKGKGDLGEDEIPIYEGVGKGRRVVGYRKR